MSASRRRSEGSACTSRAGSTWTSTRPVHGRGRGPRGREEPVARATRNGADPHRAKPTRGRGRARDAPRRARQGHLARGRAMRIFKPKWKVADGTWREGKVYSVQFSVGGKLHRKTLKTRDKRVAQMRALQIVEREEKKAVGLASPFEEHMERPVADHVADFEAYLEHRGVSQGHLEDRKLCLRRVHGGGRPEDHPRDRPRDDTAVAVGGRREAVGPVREQAVPVAPPVRTLARDDEALRRQPIRRAQRTERGDGSASRPACPDRRRAAAAARRRPEPAARSGP